MVDVETEHKARSRSTTSGHVHKAKAPAAYHKVAPSAGHEPAHKPRHDIHHEPHHGPVKTKHDPAAKENNSSRAQVEDTHGEQKKSRPRLELWGIVILIVLLVAAVIFIVLREHQVAAQAQSRQTETSKGPWVKTAAVKPAPGDKNLSLVAETRPFTEAVMYAKISGYLKEVRVDKGDKVKANQILAVIESPETRQAYLAALADANNKASIARRVRPLAKQEFVSPQEAEQVYADASVAKAKLQSEKALLDYEVVRAPFDGMVTARYADPGALIQDAANSQSSALAIVTVSQVDKLRIFAYVDQMDAASMKIGVPANITLNGRPDLHLQAPIARVSGQLDEKTKMLLVELDYDNTKGEIVPGSYVNVNMQIKSPPSFIVPSDALVVIDKKQKVAVVGSDNHAHYRDVQVLDNDGINARLLSGVKAGEKVILMSGQDLKDGGLVRQAQAQPQGPAAANAEKAPQ